MAWVIGLVEITPRSNAYIFTPSGPALLVNRYLLVISKLQVSTARTFSVAIHNIFLSPISGVG